MTVLNLLIHNIWFIFRTKINIWGIWNSRWRFCLMGKIYHACARLSYCILNFSVIPIIEIITSKYVIIINCFLKLGFKVNFIEFVFMKLVYINTVFAVLIEILIYIWMTWKYLWFNFNIILWWLKLLILFDLLLFIFKILILDWSFVKIVIWLLIIKMIHIIFELVTILLLQLSWSS